MKTIIHVNQLVIRRNKKHGTNDPVLTVKQDGLNRYAHEAIIDGPSKVIYSPEKPLSCGARVWILTEANVTLVGEASIPLIGPAPPKKIVKQMKSVQNNMTKIPRTKAMIK